MSKTKLAILVLCVAFGVNIAAFVFSKKTFLVEEVKNVWMYELPPTASPLDAYAAIDLGPQQGIIGTLFKPNFHAEKSDAEAPVLETLLADSWTWNDAKKQLTVKLKDKLIFSDGSPILPENFVQTAEWVAPQLKNFAQIPEWQALATAKWTAVDSKTLMLSWTALPAKFEIQNFLKNVMTQPFAGVIHSANLDSLKKNEKLTKGWISSGPYRVRKWNPKEITLISRDDFPITLQKGFFRTLRFQSAPVKNPACDFMQAHHGEEEAFKDHNLIPSDEVLHVFWVCRSWAQKGMFCNDPANREKFSKLISSKEALASQSLAGQKVKYRIPTGSDAFRQKIRTQIETEVTKMGGTVEEISYFFKPSTDADIELEFVVTPKSDHHEELAKNFAQMASRLGEKALDQKNLVGEIESYPVNIIMKHVQGEVFDQVFLLPDLAEKTL
jgi:hypothetical protein